MTTLWAGLVVGAIYALVAVGYNIVYIASGVFNFAQAQFVMVGAFTASVAATTIGLPLWAAIIGAAIVGGIIGALEEILAIRWLRGRGAHNELVTTLGVATLLSGLALAIWGSLPRPLGYFENARVLDLLGGRVVVTDLLTIVAVITVTIIVGQVSNRTMLGLASLATSEDREAGALRGINAGAMTVGAFVIAGGLVAALGPLIASKTYVIYNVGDLLAVKAFVALAVGGIGSYRGALLGGLGVGVVEIFAARYLGTAWQNIAIFVLLLLILMFIPKGLFARRVARAI
ncbi:branched-chain amino acid ABC transporter permease [Pseudonocardia oroxyli]|uniref:Amino acid/amide ABC transporter membrane protein 1, HAAT family n=1 Tax=Pseudonocardia oroxyli TaxID=366584 RepID=A0A1G8D1Q7_PSEOR|nr:branched-chain amino acid ABC transporter permease [Pseudonocardia oroxyli]SDH51757.1 amino acid/amide ABC transporter membrane protein 1, HAAT family [Pseudonocardia oroxyli]